MIKFEVKQEVLAKIKPSPQEHEEFLAVVKRFITRLRRAAKRLKLSTSFLVGGSFGKGTYLKGSFDVDVFVRFDESYDEGSLSKYLEAILYEAKLKKYEKQKGSRDYVSLTYTSKGMKVLFEIIPNKLISSPELAENSTDISPFHLDFLQERMRENPELSDEIRLTKQLCKAQGFYGAESYINGFSGHSIDLLISYYGSLDSFLDAARNWQEKETLDVGAKFSSRQELSREDIDEAKRSNLILIDPVLEGRNASRALGEEIYFSLLLFARTHSSLSLDDFNIPRKDLSLQKQEAFDFAKQGNLHCLTYELRFSLLHQSEDIVGAKLLKIFYKISSYFSSIGFDIFKKEFYIDMKQGKVLYIYLFQKIELARVKKIVGPSVLMDSALEGFISKRPDYFIEGSKVCAYEHIPKYTLRESSDFSLNDISKFLSTDTSFISSIRRKLK